MPVIVNYGLFYGTDQVLELRNKNIILYSSAVSLGPQ